MSIGDDATTAGMADGTSGDVESSSDRSPSREDGLE
jgi:hypothetical protein